MPNLILLYSHILFWKMGARRSKVCVLLLCFIQWETYRSDWLRTVMYWVFYICFLHEGFRLKRRVFNTCFSSFLIMVVVLPWGFEGRDWVQGCWRTRISLIFSGLCSDSPGNVDQQRSESWGYLHIWIKSVSEETTFCRFEQPWIIDIFDGLSEFLKNKVIYVLNCSTLNISGLYFCL